MTVEERAYIRTLAESLGWGESEALAKCVEAAQDAHHATNEARVARSGAAFDNLSATDAYRLTAWLRKRHFDAHPGDGGDSARYREHRAALQRD